MKKFYVISKKDSKSLTIKNKIKTALLSEKLIYTKDNPECIICVGGDGTILNAVHQYINHIDNVCFVGVHTGTLGFLTDYTHDNYNELIYDIVNKQPNVHERRLLEISVKHKICETLYAINEVRIENPKQTLTLSVSIDEQFFETCRCSGLCISTQIGSTAYNRSIGGAIIDNDLELLQLNEIAPIQHSRYRSLGSPFIIHGNRSIKINSNNFTNSILCYDHLYMDLIEPEYISCKLSKKTLKICKFKESHYFEKLKMLYE